MDTVRPVLRFAMALLKETLALELAGDRLSTPPPALLDAPPEDPTKPESTDTKPAGPGPRRQQVEACIAAMELWLKMHGRSSSALPKQDLDADFLGSYPSSPMSPTAHYNAALAAMGAASAAAGVAAAGLATAREQTPPSVVARRSRVSMDYSISESEHTLLNAAASPRNSAILSPTSPILEHGHHNGNAPQTLADRLRGFNWADPELSNVPSVERFITAAVRSRAQAAAIRRVDLRALDASASDDLLGAVIRFAPNLETVLLASSQPLDLDALDIILGNGASSNRLAHLAVHTLHGGSGTAKAAETAAASVVDVSQSSLELDDSVSSSSYGVVESHLKRRGPSENLAALAAVLARCESLSIDSNAIASTVFHFVAERVGCATLKKLEIRAEDDLAAHDATADSQPALQTSDLIAIIERCPSLESLNLVGHPIDASPCSDAPPSPGSSTTTPVGVDHLLTVIASRLPKLKSLRTPTRTRSPVSPSSISAVLIGCPVLEDLALSSCSPSDSPDSAGCVRALVNGQSLRNVSITAAAATDSTEGQETLLPHPELEMALLEFLERRGRSLRGLEVRGWPSSDRTLRALARHCQVLDALVLSPCGGIRSEAALRTLLAKGKSLRMLELEGAAPVVLEAAEAEVKARGMVGVAMGLGIGVLNL
ncbi:hypothetical protein HK101_010469 [Irineochytrium annulatum]|nr:hypothetical protein HK101_010469 [Irineochytrium annulatum]